jgi:lipoprotein NlpI
MRWIIGDKATKRSGASPSHMGRFETNWLARTENRATLTDLVAFRGGAAFAQPNMYDFLEAEGIDYAIRPAGKSASPSANRPSSQAAGRTANRTTRSDSTRAFTTRRRVGPVRGGLSPKWSGTSGSCSRTVGLIITNLSYSSKNVVGFYNKRGKRPYEHTAAFLVIRGQGAGPFLGERIKSGRRGARKPPESSGDDSNRRAMRIPENIVRRVPLIAVGVMAAAFLNEARHAVLALLPSPVGVGAQTSRSSMTTLSRDPCFSTSHTADQRIARCTALLRSGTLSATKKAAYYNRGLAYYGRGQYDLAIADYTAALRMKRNDADAYYNRGIAYHYGKRQYGLAIADYTAAVRINPKYAEAYYNRGLAYYYGKREYDLAIADYTAVLRIKPNLRNNPNHRLAYYDRGNAYHAKGQEDLAIADYTAVLRITPGYRYAYYQRGNAYLAKGQDDLAITDYTAAARIRADDERSEAARRERESQAVGAAGKHRGGVARPPHASALPGRVLQPRDRILPKGTIRPRDHG